MKPSAEYCPTPRTPAEYEIHVKLARAAGRFPIDPATLAETMILTKHFPHLRPAMREFPAYHRAMPAPLPATFCNRLVATFVANPAPFRNSLQLTEAGQ